MHTRHSNTGGAPHADRVKIKHQEGHTLPVKPHAECQSAVKIVQERGQQSVAGSNLRQEAPIVNSSSLVDVPMGWLVDEFVGEKSWRWKER